jgi:hypothetical protein
MKSIDIEIAGIRVTVSQETVDAFEEHSAYCSAGTDWLVRFDPKAHKEQELIESVKDAIKADFDVAISGLAEEEKDNAEEEFFDLTENDWWDDLAEAIEASK